MKKRQRKKNNKKSWSNLWLAVAKLQKLAEAELLLAESLTKAVESSGKTSSPE